MTADKDVELIRVAKAVWHVAAPDHQNDWNDLSTDEKEHWRGIAKAAIRAFATAPQDEVALEDAEIGRRWRENSSLEAWFPFTAEELNRLKKQIADMSTAALAEKDDSGWMPIETAPKDGTKFLGFRDGRIADAYFIPRDDCEMWFFYGSSGSVQYFPQCKPTYWRPLPPLPKGDE